MFGEQGELKLAIYQAEAAAQAVTLGNPPEDQRPWTAVEPPSYTEGHSRYSSWAVFEEDYHPREVEEEVGEEEEESHGYEVPHAGTTRFVVDADDRVFDSGAAIAIEYKRNTALPECAENQALATPFRGLSRFVVTRILAEVQWKSGWLTKVQIRTLADGSFDIKQHFEPNIQGLILPKHVTLPSIALSSLHPTHRLMSHHSLYVVKTSLDCSADVSVFKGLDHGCRAEDVEFISHLPDVDFLLRPTHLVVDGNDRARGLLLPHHPASSLSLTLDRLHPDATPPILLPFVAAQSGWSLPASPVSVPWLVKLGWLVDITASVAWLHTQNIFWGDLKTQNIIVCTDGHCRLIDYVPCGSTIGWSPPEAAQSQDPTVAADIFALGLVVWAVLVEVGQFERQVDYVRPVLPWNQTTPRWLQNLVVDCLHEQPHNRPSARDVYAALVDNRWPL
ncbi:kinase-like domain-containing protein [Mycena metata]|uniref:Kinase-like domain-containing protein n=1 Tax=Mycena metata TaxID=1033252 RepID=A0AAD7IPN7_9AGAR|nr:kinase-like domain-containing protein [Mycena metata]